MNIERDGDSVIMHLPARCEGKIVKEFHEFLNDEKNKSLTKLVFDFSDTYFIDSSSVGMLVTIDKNCKAQNGTVTIKNLNNEIMELFTDTGLDLLFNIETTEGVTEASVNIFETSVDIRLDIKTEEKNDVCILHLSGVMNHPIGTKYFKQQFLLAIANYRKVLLDFEDLTFFDSLSVSVVLSMHKLLRETGGILRFCNTNYIVNDLFITLNINQIIPMYETIEGALADWN